MFVANVRNRWYPAVGCQKGAGPMTRRNAVTKCRSAFGESDVLRGVFVSMLLTAAVPAMAQSTGKAEGEAIYRERCVGCHETGAARAPDLATLRAMSPDRVLTALRSGSMSTQAQGLSNAQLDNLSRFVAGAATGQDTAQASGACAETSALLIDPQAHPRWNGWGGDSSQQRFQPAAMARLDADDVPRLKLKWAFGFPGATRAQAQPTLMGGQLFVGSQSGKVYALDPHTGCTHWVFDAGFSVRSAITIAASAAMPTRSMP
jgi:polyvinyl alcohol dehydrogenase (cytochrome)